VGFPCAFLTRSDQRRTFNHPQTTAANAGYLEDVRAALSSADAHSPKGAIEDGDRRLQIYTNDKASRAEDYWPLVIAYRDGAAVRLSDVAAVEDSVENTRNTPNASTSAITSRVRCASLAHQKSIWRFKSLRGLKNPSTWVECFQLNASQNCAIGFGHEPI
jgi:hypothetical protein